MPDECVVLRKRRPPTPSSVRWCGEAGSRLLRALPVEERRVVVNGVSTVVLEGGDGPPLLLLHGGIECGGAYWAPVVPRLARDHRLVVPDVPGRSRSTITSTCRPLCCEARDRFSTAGPCRHGQRSSRSGRGGRSADAQPDGRRSSQDVWSSRPR
ncbi:alpha/beta fold hydrolase [Kribbella turkmenica]|uniref:alpha/beta fold hydrolase n=1 Tax=Kribbella turkmenica TaxID=2530375 RepID=UPI003899122E